MLLMLERDVFGISIDSSIVIINIGDYAGVTPARVAYLLSQASDGKYMLQVLWRKWIHWSKRKIMSEKSIGCFPCWPKWVGCECPATVWLTCELRCLHCTPSTSWSHHGKQFFLSGYIKVKLTIPMCMCGALLKSIVHTYCHLLHDYS